MQRSVASTCQLIVLAVCLDPNVKQSITNSPMRILLTKIIKRSSYRVRKPEQRISPRPEGPQR
jgi:hypothetical protein